MCTCIILKQLPQHRVRKVASAVVTKPNQAKISSLQPPLDSNLSLSHSFSQVPGPEILYRGLVPHSRDVHCHCLLLLLLHFAFHEPHDRVPPRLFTFIRSSHHRAACMTKKRQHKVSAFTHTYIPVDPLSSSFYFSLSYFPRTLSACPMPTSRNSFLSSDCSCISAQPRSSRVQFPACALSLPGQFVSLAYLNLEPGKLSGLHSTRQVTQQRDDNDPLPSLSCVSFPSASSRISVASVQSGVGYNIPPPVPSGHPAHRLPAAGLKRSRARACVCVCVCVGPDGFLTDPAGDAADPAGCAACPYLPVDAPMH